MGKKYNVVYLTINKLNGKCYVGSHLTNNINDNYYGSGIYISNSLNKYKKENFHKIILKKCDTIIKARNLERYYIDIFDTLSPNGYNISPTGGMGENQFGLHSEETKKKLSKIRMGVEPWNKGKTGLYKHSKDSIEKLRQLNIGEKNANYGNRGKKNPMFGIKKTKEHRKKMSKSKIGDMNPNAGKYKILTPDNKTFVYLSATKFINEHPEYNINRHFIYSASKSLKENYNGWKIIKLN